MDLFCYEPIFEACARLCGWNLLMLPIACGRVPVQKPTKLVPKGLD